MICENTTGARKLSKARKLLLRLAESAWWQGSYFGRGRPYTDTPGRFIQRFSPEEHEILEQLKSEDVGVLFPPYPQ